MCATLSPPMMPWKVSMWLRNSRVATRIWWIESHSSARTLGSYSTNLSRLAARALITAAAADFLLTSGLSNDGGRGALSRESPKAEVSLDGEAETWAPEAIKCSVAAFMKDVPSSDPARSPASSISHSLQDDCLPPGRKERAVTWSSQNSA